MPLPIQAAKPAMANHPASPISLLGGLALLLFLAFLFQPAQGGAMAEGSAAGRTRRSSEVESYVPVREVVYRSAALAASAEAFEPFQLCMGCRCCSPTNSSSCVVTRCCYAINCNIPGKPFGVCGFSPITCDCGAYNNCTSSR